MNVLLWITQTVLAVLYIVAGGTKVFMFERFAQQVASTGSLPQGVWVAIGIFEGLCGLALILPAVIRIQPLLTPLAASCLAVEGILFAVFHAAHAEYSPMAYGLVSAALAAFVAYGRFALLPLETRVTG